MDRAAIFKPQVPVLDDLKQALDALGINLRPDDLEKTAENAALLTRHWQTVSRALTSGAPDGVK